MEVKTYNSIYNLDQDGLEPDKLMMKAMDQLVSLVYEQHEEESQYSFSKDKIREYLVNLYQSYENIDKKTHIQVMKLIHSYIQDVTGNVFYYLGIGMDEYPKDCFKYTFIEKLNTHFYGIFFYLDKKIWKLFYFSNTTTSKEIVASESLENIIDVYLRERYENIDQSYTDFLMRLKN